MWADGILLSLVRFDLRYYYLLYKTEASMSHLKIHCTLTILRFVHFCMDEIKMLHRNFKILLLNIMSILVTPNVAVFHLPGK